MITIPTGDLTGIIGDVIPFASPDTDLPKMNCVRLEWDGSMLHAQSIDGIRLGWSSWTPDDDAKEEHQDSLFTEWGGADDPWSATICLDDAKDLAKCFKLPAKEIFTPLTIEKVQRTVRVVRTRDTGHSAFTSVMHDTFVEFPDVRKVLSGNDVALPTSALAFNAKYLADFAKVRPRGPMHMMFTGPTGVVHISIGERFSGAIQPVRDFDKEPAKPEPELEDQVQF